jgi:hypothetical protein
MSQVPPAAAVAVSPALVSGYCRTTRTGRSIPPRVRKFS